MNTHLISRGLLSRNATSWLLLVLLLTHLVGCNGTQTAIVNPAPIEQPQSSSAWIIGLDPGHGWKGDPGAVGNDLQEKDVALDIAVHTKAILESNGFQVIMTRTGDDEHDKTHAAEVINEQKPDIVVSIHANSSKRSNATGTEACYTVGKSTDVESRALASLLTDLISNKLSLTNRGIFPENSDSVCARRKSTGWNQLYIHDMDPPAVIIETAFISNPHDADLLKNRSQDFAQAIAGAIMTYCQTHGNPPMMGAPGVPQPSAVVTIVPATVSPVTPAILTDLPTVTPTHLPYTPTLPGSGGKIAFTYEGSLWVMNADGSGRTRITENLGAWSRLSWSPDAKQIAFTAKSSIYIANVDGSGVIRLEGRPGCQAAEPSWSPDGKRIAYYFQYGGMPTGVAIMNADGSNSVDLADGSFPAWSPDGTRIAIEGRPSGTGDTGLYILDTSGNVLSRVADMGMYPDWSPDGSKIVHVITKPGFDPFIGIVDLAGGGELQLPVKGLVPSWSPDGQRIAFFTFTNGRTIFTMNPDGSDIQELGPGADPEWGP